MSKCWTRRYKEFPLSQSQAVPRDYFKHLNCDFALFVKHEPRPDAFCQSVGQEDEDLPTNAHAVQKQQTKNSNNTNIYLLTKQSP